MAIASNGIGALRAIGADETAVAAGCPYPKPERTPPQPQGRRSAGPG